MYTSIKTIKGLESVVGTLSAPSKMPCFSYSTSASRCKVGSKLKLSPNSVCAGCYADDRGNYGFSNVKDALERRYQSLSNLSRWKDAISDLIYRKEKSGYFRWHDSGDLQSTEHLDAIVTVARRNPEIQFWIPTREYRFVREWKEANGEFPDNLVVRLSAYFRGQPAKVRGLNQPTSTVGWEGSAHVCPSRHQGNKCGDCRACWDKTVPNVDYPYHR